MTFGPVTVVRPGASVAVAAMGPQGLQGYPGKDGAPGSTGPAPWAPLIVWQSGQTYTPTAPASSVFINGSSYVCTALHTSGAFANDLANNKWQIAASVGQQGTPGTPGSTWYSGSGFPSGAVGINGDYFFRTDTYDVLLKVTGNWAAIANLKGLAGNTVASGSSAPAASIGVNGDFYIDFSAWAIYGPKVNGAWPSSGQSLIGPMGPGNGSVNPIGSTTQGNIAVFGSSNTVIKDGGRPRFTVVDNPSSPYASIDYDEVWWLTSSGAVTQSLPASPMAGVRVRAYRSGANIVTIVGNGKTIAGAAADLVLNLDKVGVELTWDVPNATWYVTPLARA